ncbi:MULTISPECIES: hypothetical protein [unclassified Nocardiopsis]|uniref:hypothetical protein n=1 Tax=Nocardiopsis TaxID=2013 RepID=UPI00387B0BA1
MVPPPSALRVSAARRELRMRARPGLRTLVVVLMSAPLAGCAVLLVPLVSSVFGRVPATVLGVAVCVMLALLLRLDLILRRTQASHPLPADADPVRLAVATHQVVVEGRPTGDPGTDRLGRAMAESIRATYTSGFFRFAFVVVVVLLGGMWAFSPLLLWDLPTGEAITYAAPQVFLSALAGFTGSVVLRQGRRARAFIAAYDRGAA